MPNFFDLFLAACGLLKWFFLIIWWPLYPNGIDAKSLVMPDKDIPKLHQSYIEQFILEKENQCLRHGIDLEIEIDPYAIYTLMIADDGTMATIFHAVLNCAGKGNLWSSISGTKTFILVDDQIFENWFTAPPKRLIVDGSIALLLSLDGTQCDFSNKDLAINLVTSCHALVHWKSEAKTFYGFGSPLEMVQKNCDFGTKFLKGNVLNYCFE